jgi:rare lipoprotein A
LVDVPDDTAAVARDAAKLGNWPVKIGKPYQVAGITYYPADERDYREDGVASWYGPGFYGNRTASGEVFRPGTLTAAHRTLAFGTRVRVTNLWNGRSTVVRINDRGPFHGGRIIDLAHGAAQQLGVTASGVAQVRLEVLD